MMPCRPAMPASAATSSSEATPPLAITGVGRGGDGGGETVDVRTAEQPVAGDVGDDERRRGREAAERVGQRDVARGRPPVHGEHAVAVVESDGDRDHGRRRRRRGRDGRPRPSPSRRGPRRRRASAAASSSERTPPPAWTLARPATAAATAATTGRFTGSPVRAASRSTTWIHVAPPSQNASATSTASPS